MKRREEKSINTIQLAEPGRGYDEMKKELEEIQKVIVDDSGKFTEKEKEDANIKYEKVKHSTLIIFTFY